MGFSIGGFLKNVVKPMGMQLIKAAAPGVAEALKGIVGQGLNSVFEKGTSAVSGLLGKVPFIGRMLSGLVQKYAPQLQGLANNFFGGQIDNLLARITGGNAARPVPGAAPGTTITTPPISDPGRATSIITNTPTSSTAASTATGGSSGVGGNLLSGPSGGYAPYPKPPSDPKDLGQQQAYQEAMLNYQQQQQMLMQQVNLVSTMMKAAADSIKSIIQTFR